MYGLDSEEEMSKRRSWSGNVLVEGQRQRCSKKLLLFHSSTHVLRIDLNEVGPTDPADSLP